MTIDEMIEQLQKAKAHPKNDKKGEAEVVFDMHGEYVLVTELEYQPREPATEEYEADGVGGVVISSEILL